MMKSQARRLVAVFGTAAALSVALPAGSASAVDRVGCGSNGQSVVYSYGWSQSTCWAGSGPSSVGLYNVDAAWAGSAQFVLGIGSHYFVANPGQSVTLTDTGYGSEPTVVYLDRV